MRSVIAVPSGIDVSARDLLSLRRIPVRVATVAAGLLALAAASLATAAPAAPAAPAVRAAPTVSPAVIAEALAALAVLRTHDEPLDDELLPLPTRGPAGGLVPLRSAPALAAPPPRPASGVARLAIPRLGIDHYVERVAVVGGVMESPVDGIYAVGWYPQFGTPGSGGNAVFSAHETWDLQRGPFYSLRLLQPGDTLTLRMRSGAEYRYVVFSNRRYPVETLPLGDVIWPPAQPGGEEWATFITCGGRYVRRPGGYWDYLDRDVIVARRLG